MSQVSQLMCTDRLRDPLAGELQGILSTQCWEEASGPAAGLGHSLPANRELGGWLMARNGQGTPAGHCAGEGRQGGGGCTALELG